MRITEIFHSVQGEGADTGLPTVFVRTTGCHLRCVWCDSAYAFYGGESVSVDEIVRTVQKWPTRRVCFTGGEPVLQPEGPELVQRLLDGGYKVVIETSGSLDLARYRAMNPRDRLVLSVDVKCPGSEMQSRNKLDELPLLEAHDQVKFVIKDSADYAFAKSVVADVRVPCPVVFQPVWGDGDARWLADAVLEDGLDVRVSLQIHKHIWGEGPGH
ncbi:MAG: radical SAM protein [bacterium]